MPTSPSELVQVWLWLPGETEPVTVGSLVGTNANDELSFRYDEHYLSRQNAMQLYGVPLKEGKMYGPTQNLGMLGCIRDAVPDIWGRRVLAKVLLGSDTASDQLSNTTLLLEAGSNRIGALDFQRSPTEYVPRDRHAELEQLHRATQIIEEGRELSDGLRAAIKDGTAIGGARPKVMVCEFGTEMIAKFSTSSDTFDIVGAEAASIALARHLNIPVTASKVAESLGKKVLLMERFDRVPGGQRRMVVSALTMLGLPESWTPIGSYVDLLEVLRTQSVPGLWGEQLFRRIAFNIMISNTDDHLRNHAAFWDGSHLELTPAYDLSPCPRSGETAKLALPYSRDGHRDANLRSLIEFAYLYGLEETAAAELVWLMVETVRQQWDEAADEAKLTEIDKMALWGRQFLNAGALYGL